MTLLSSGLRPRAFAPALALALAALAASPLLAKDKRQGPEVGRAQALQDLAHCRTITEDAARLACFDKAAATFDEAEASGDIVVVDKAQAKEVKRQAFGLNLNGALGIFDRGIHAEKVDSVALTVAEAHQDGYGKWIITTSEGQIWRQIDSDPLDEAPRKGQEAVVSQGSLGSFFIKVGHDRSIRAHRDQ
ncbi:MAG TPA: hypothetical protein VG407_05600 [Caulobacteraceae bacterium]|jgi:hypothetical protein|nr:hypothetical protein [Caulobacteraceae bacterium]